MKIYALTTEDGTAADETCLCENCLAEHSDYARHQAHKDVDKDGKWHDVSENEACVCINCGANGL